MQTRIFRASGAGLPRADLQALSQIIREGGIVVFPTDTVYGLGCSLFSRPAIKRIYKLKGRDHEKPLPILIHDSSEALLLAEEVTGEARTFMKKFWPGPLTLIFKGSSLARLVMGGKDTVGVRLPADKVLRQLIKSAGVPLASTSANISGRPPACSSRDAIHRFGGRVEALIHGGKMRLGVASTVVDASSYPCTVIREGAISKARLLKALGR